MSDDCIEKYLRLGELKSTPRTPNNSEKIVEVASECDKINVKRPI